MKTSTIWLLAAMLIVACAGSGWIMYSCQQRRIDGIIKTVRHDTVQVVVRDTIPSEITRWKIQKTPFPVYVLEDSGNTDASVYAWHVVDSLAGQNEFWRTLALRKKMAGVDYTATLVCTPGAQLAGLDPFDGTTFECYHSDTTSVLPPVEPSWFETALHTCLVSLAIIGVSTLIGIALYMAGVIR